MRGSAPMSRRHSPAACCRRQMAQRPRHRPAGGPLRAPRKGETSLNKAVLKGRTRQHSSEHSREQTAAGLERNMEDYKAQVGQAASATSPAACPLPAGSPGTTAPLQRAGTTSAVRKARLVEMWGGSATLTQWSASGSYLHQGRPGAGRSGQGKQGRWGRQDGQDGQDARRTISCAAGV